MKKNKNKSANMTEEDWKELNEITKRDRGISSITFEDIYGEKTEEKVNLILDHDVKG